MSAARSAVLDHTHATDQSADDMARACEALADARGALRRALGTPGALYGLTVVDLLLVRLADYDDPSRLDRLAGR